jgi:hypothetical protein
MLGFVSVTLPKNATLFCFAKGNSSASYNSNEIGRIRNAKKQFVIAAKVGKRAVTGSLFTCLQVI